MHISKKIVEARKQKGLTQEELADLANVTVRTIQRIESGETQPRSFTLRTIAEALGTSFEELAAPATETNPSIEKPIPGNNDTGYDKDLLKNIAISCFCYLVVPFIHFLLPIYILKKSGTTHAPTITFARSIIRQQIYWQVALTLSMLITLAWNFTRVYLFNKTWFIHYLWPFFIMYFLNALIITGNIRGTDKRESQPASA